MRLIDANRLRSDILGVAQMVWGGMSMIGTNTFEKILNLQPTVDPIRHGEWIDQECGGYECSECEMVTDHNTRYCPNCGTRMEIKE